MQIYWIKAQAPRRVLALAKKAGRRLHVLHITTADEIPLLAAAKDFATAETTPRTSAPSAPTRCMPVFALTWTSVTTPDAADASETARTPLFVYTVGVSRCATTSGIAGNGGSESRSTGAVIPASRSSTPSSTVATASQVAPPSSAARATGAAPWP